MKTKNLRKLVTIKQALENFSVKLFSDPLNATVCAVLFFIMSIAMLVAGLIKWNIFPCIIGLLLFFAARIVLLIDGKEEPCQQGKN